MDWLGTIPFAAPEWVLFKQRDIRSDLYALGVTFWALTTRSLPTNTIEKRAFVEWLRTADIPDVRSVDATLSSEFAQILFRLTRPDPEARYSGPSAAIAEVRRLLDNRRTPQCGR